MKKKESFYLSIKYYKLLILITLLFLTITTLYLMNTNSATFRIK